MNRLFVVRIRGTVGVRKNIKDTLDMLKLSKVSSCVVIDDRDSYVGMLKKSKDYITYGDASPDIIKRLILKWGRLPGNERISEAYVKEKIGLDIDEFVQAVMNFEHEIAELGIKDVFHIHPPRKGYKNIKKGFGQGGSLGNRGTEINALLERMI